MVAVALVRRPPAKCWDVFVDASLLPAWVPGLRRARVVRRDEHGRPAEVAFEHGASLSYSLLYEYDEEARRIEWRPGVGARDAVAGFVSFAPHPEGCEVSYAIRPTMIHRDAPRDVNAILGEFVRFAERGR